MEQQIYLSIVIRTRNQAQSLRHVFEALAAQQCSFPWEIIVVDNDSQDDTLELCKQYNTAVISIHSNEFTYGHALNLGISKARGELIVLCSAHSVPVGSNFLERSALPFVDPQMAAARCLSATSKEQTAAWYTVRDIQYTSVEEQRAAETGESWMAHYPSATCCIIRRSVWEEIPFDEQLEANEDKVWASQVLSRRYKIRSCAEAIFVYNRQRKRWWDDLQRNNRLYLGLYRTTGYVPMTWPNFFIRVLRWTLSAPIVAMRYFVQNLLIDLSLVTIPWQAKFPTPPGSLREYNKPIISS